MKDTLSPTEILNEVDWEICDEILSLKAQKNAVILAHYYQEPIIQDLADFVGDSLDLSRRAADTNADIIVFAGVHFMAETAKILSPDKKVLIPDLNASCSLAESCSLTEFEKFVKENPGHTIVSYINSSAEIKAKSDFICTSSNAIRVIESIPADERILFLPDKNLGEYLIRKTGRPMTLWDGACSVHEAFSIDKILRLHQKHPKAKFIAHPESERHILKIADFIGSTSSLINFVKMDNSTEYIVATEAGILHQMQKAVPDKTLIPAPAYEDNTCSCSECDFMKMNSVSKLYQCLKNETPEITIPEITRLKAIEPIQRMLALSQQRLN
ncbi:MAG: quinolinate synthase NadA [Bacteroidetes bacterium]|nr:quinolinate synthase NadA [Bacteroidota bacterium]MDA1121107.1 quinolinate synthase NadA [Bacteroidota bacterium]